MAGIDVGSTTTKAVLLDGRVIVGKHAIPTGVDLAAAAEECLDAACRAARVAPEKLAALVATGYGRDRVHCAAVKVTEITCHARGARALVPSARVVVDVGGQDSKVIRLDDDGMVADFVMNDKCAAGTGRFLEVMAARLGVALDDFGTRWERAKEAARISSTCTVFAESEVISLLSHGVRPEPIVKGLCDAVAARLAGMVHRVGLGGGLVMTGGVSRNEGVRRSLQERLQVPVAVPDGAQFAGAYGAALIASGLNEGRGERERPFGALGRIRA
ncbi:MAG: acyl-CoA dehydratase activase [Betaproteobacteria bacterium]